MSVGNYHVDVELCTCCIKSVEVVAALGLFKVNVDSSVYVSAGSHVVAVHTTDKVVNIGTNVLLNHTELVSSACNGINYAKGRSLGIGINGSAGNVNAFKSTAHELVGAAVVLHLKSGNGDGCAYNESVVGESVAVNGLVLVTLNNDGGVVIAVKRGDLTGKNEVAGCGLAVSKTVKLIEDLLSIVISLGKLIGSKSICILACHELNYELAVANLLGSEVAVLGDGDGGVGAVCTNAPNKVKNLNGPNAALVLIEGEYRAFLGVEADELGVLNSAGVSIFGSLNLSVNVGLNAVNHGVPLVAAINLLYEEVGSFLGIKGGVDELVLVVLSGVKSIESLVEATLKKEELICNAFYGSLGDTAIVNSGHLEVVGLALRCAISSDGSGKRVAELLGIIVGEVYGVVVSLSAGLDGNLVRVGCPFNGENNTVELNLCNYVEVRHSGFLLGLVDVMKEIDSICNGNGSCGCIGLTKTDHVLYLVDYVAGCEHTEAKNGDNEKCDNSFHFFLLILNFLDNKLVKKW